MGCQASAGKMVDANVCLTALGGIPSHMATETVDVDVGSSSPAARFPKVPLSTDDLMCMFCTILGRQKCNWLFELSVLIKVIIDIPSVEVRAWQTLQSRSAAELLHGDLLTSVARIGHDTAYPTRLIHRRIVRRFLSDDGVRTQSMPSYGKVLG